MDGSITKEAKLKAKNRKLRTKVKGLRKSLETANGKILALEKENEDLQNMTENLRTTLESEKPPFGGQTALQMDSNTKMRNNALDGALADITPSKIHTKMDVPSISGSTESSTSYSSSEKPNQKRLSILRPPSPSLSTAETSEGSPKGKTGITKPKVRFLLDSGTFEAGYDETTAAPAPATLSGSEADATTIEASDSMPMDPISSNQGDILADLSTGVQLSVDSLSNFASLFFDQDANFIKYLSSQHVKRIGSMPSLLHSTENPAIGSQEDEITFVEPPENLSCIHASPFPAYSEQVTKIRFINTTADVLSLTLYTFASEGCFLGFNLSRSTLRPGLDARLSLSLVGTSPNLCHSLAILEVTSTLNLGPSQFKDASTPPNGSQSTSSQHQDTRYYFFGSSVQVSPPKPDASAWKVKLTHLIENTAVAIFSTPSYSIYPATFLGANITSRIFKRHDSLSDLAAFERMISLSNTLTHPNIASVVGISDKRPFRILSQSWKCSLTLALLATWDQTSKSPNDTHSGFSLASTLSSASQGVFKSKLSDITRLGRLEVPILSNLRDRLQIALDACNALSKLHESSLVHRNLSTASFGVISSDYAVMVEYLDAIDEKSSLPPSPKARFTPTLAWLAPELSTPESQCTKESDVFALGILLFDLLIGAPVSSILGHAEELSGPVSALVHPSLSPYPSGTQGVNAFFAIFDAWCTVVFGGPLLDAHLTHVVIRDGETKATEIMTDGPMQKVGALIALSCHFAPSKRPSLSVVASTLENVLCDLS